MKRGISSLSVLLLLFFGLAFTACESGDDGSSLPLDGRLVGQWEGVIPEDPDGPGPEPSVDIPAIITITGSNRMTMMQVYPDDWEGDEGDPGQIMGGQKSTITTERDPLSPDEGTMFWNPEYEWVEEGDEDPITDAPVPCDNWYETDEEDMEFAYEFIDATTFIIYGTPAGNLTFYKGTAPKADSKLTGTWRVEDTDDEVRMDLSLSSNGSFSMKQYDISNPASPVLMGTESGTYGVYRSVEGYRYLTVSSTNWTDDAGTPVKGYKWSRMRFMLLMFQDPDPDILLVVSDGEMGFERQGADLKEPAPDAATVGMWYGEEEFDGGTFDSIVTFNDDNTFEKILLYQDGDPKAGEMAVGMRGYYIANNGEMIIWVEQACSEGAWNSEHYFLDMAYSIAGGVMTVRGEFNRDEISTQERESIEPPTVPASLVGTWWHEENHDGHDYRDVVIIEADGDMTIRTYIVDDPGSPVLDHSQRGTCGVTTIDGVDSFIMVSEYRDETPPIDPIPTDGYFDVMRMTYVFTSGPPVTFTLGGVMEFEKQ